MEELAVRLTGIAGIEFDKDKNRIRYVLHSQLLSRSYIFIKLLSAHNQYMFATYYWKIFSDHFWRYRWHWRLRSSSSNCRRAKLSRGFGQRSHCPLSRTSSNHQGFRTTPRDFQRSHYKGKQNKRLGYKVGWEQGWTSCRGTYSSSQSWASPRCQNQVGQRLLYDQKSKRTSIGKNLLPLYKLLADYLLAGNWTFSWSSK
jgi:hypothetical protein